MFTDRASIRVIAGKGGNGVVAWRRERYISKGGPNGGNGGAGGSVYVRADERLLSLEAYRHHRLKKAESGQSGGSNRKQGRRGRDLILPLPCGTLIKDQETQELLADLTEPGQEYCLCLGGRGGRGNASFASSTRRAPNWATPGSEGAERRVEFELKLIADVGLVGFPNGGKSTLINALTHVPVKIAPYPFTTLSPNLGLVEFEDYSRLFIADIPGLIEGAHDNRGLGYEFLRHIERTSILLFVLDAAAVDQRSPLEDYRVLRHELAAYDSTLLERPFLVVLNKIDLPSSRELVKTFRQEVVLPPNHLFEISALSGEGIDQVKEALWKLHRLAQAGSSLALVSG